MSAQKFTGESLIENVMAEPLFQPFGRLLFPVQGGFWQGCCLKDLQMVWYSHIDVETTVAIVNNLYGRVRAGELVFFDIYTEEEKLRDPAKRDTGLFFFRGQSGARTAICNAGGGFAYVGAMQDSFPHALTLAQKGFNAFALIYRPGAGRACQDLARAIHFLFEQEAQLGINMADYSLWGGSAGARMAAWLGRGGPEAYGEKAHPHAAAVIMQYTGLSDVSPQDPATYACVGDRDSIADWRVMKTRLDAMSAYGISTECHVYPGLGHGFGLGRATLAQGWIEDAVRFWERQMR